MQNSDAPGGKQIQELQQLWQESTKNESLTIKEKTMMTNINPQLSSFEVEFGTGKKRSVLTYGLMTCIWSFELIQDIRQDEGIYKIIFHAIALLFSAGMLFFHFWVHRNIRHYDESSMQSYVEMNLWRVEQQLQLEQRIFPTAIAIMFAFLTLEITADFSLWHTFLFGMMMTIAFIGIHAYRKGRVDDFLKPLRDKLQSALQQLNEH